MKKIVIILGIVIIIYIISASLMAIFLHFKMNEIFVEEEKSDKKFIEAIQNGEVDFKEITKDEWDIAILVTNENEYDIIEKCKSQNIIDVNYVYKPMNSYTQRLYGILFVKNGIVIDKILYDSMYNEIICKNSIYFYNEESIFKVKKKESKTILEQI